MIQQLHQILQLFLVAVCIQHLDHHSYQGKQMNPVFIHIEHFNTEPGTLVRNMLLQL